VLAAIAIAGALIAVLLLTGGGGAKQMVRLTPVANHGVQTIVNDLKTLVDANTG
jgi:hypothetical protein